MIKRISKALLATGIAIGLSSGVAFADYPEKPITMVIPYGAGGSHDLNARVITSTIPEFLGQAMIVRLTPGAGGQKGTQEVANAAADGYTLLFSSNYVDMLQQYVEALPYDPMEDFIPIARVNYAPIAVVVAGDSPYNTIEELTAAAKENPGGVRVSHSGNWGALFVPAVEMMRELDVEFNLVPYQGGGPAMQALLTGDVDVTMGFPSTLGPQLESGKVRVLATATPERIYDDVPTFSELGMNEDVGLMHRVVLAPAGTPDDVIATLTEAFEALGEDKTFTGMMGRLGETIDIIDGPEYQVMREHQSESYKALVDSLTSQ